MTTTTDTAVDLRSVWEDRQADAEAMIPLIGSLSRTNGVVTTIYGRSLLNASVKDLLRTRDGSTGTQSRRR